MVAAAVIEPKRDYQYFRRERIAQGKPLSTDAPATDADWEIIRNTDYPTPAAEEDQYDNSQPPPHLTKQSKAAWHFTEQAGKTVRYDHSRKKWLIWTGQYWMPDKDQKIERIWLGVLKQRYQDALNIPDDDDRKKVVDAVHSAGSTSAAINAGLAIAATMKPIATSGEEWDTDPYLLGCENGTVDLRTGKLHNGIPAQMISLSTGLNYNPDATCERWDTFFTEVFAGDTELAGWLDLALGAAIIGTSKELLVINWGELANNGKTKFAGIVQSVLGDYAGVVSIESFVNAKRRAGAATPDLMTLRTTRVVFTSEPDRSAKLRGGTLKKMVSEDILSLRANYGDEEKKKPGHTFFLNTNHLPNVDDADNGFWRRIALVPWTVHFLKPGEEGSGPQQDENLPKKLAAEAEGILAKIVRNAVLYANSQSEDPEIKKTGRDLWPMPQSVQAQTAWYRENEDKLLPFINSELAYGKGRAIYVGELRKAYKEWCDREDIPTFDRFGPKNLINEVLSRSANRGVTRKEDTNKHLFYLSDIGLRGVLDPDSNRGEQQSKHDSGASGVSESVCEKSLYENDSREFTQMGTDAPDTPVKLPTTCPKPGHQDHPWWSCPDEDNPAEDDKAGFGR